MSDAFPTNRKDDMRDRIIVALDLPDASRALEMARRLRGHVGWVKVGVTLFYAEGPEILRELRSLGFRVFVDLKLHDIPHQVEGACATLTRIGADMMTVHASGGRAMLEGAVWATARAAEKFRAPKPLVVAVTVLTSLDDAALAEMGWSGPAPEIAASLGALARECGCDGAVCSPHEAAQMRALFGPAATIVTPGVRLPGSGADDQARVATPAEALAAGATYLVVGRPITEAPDPVAAIRALVEGASR